MFSRLYRVQPAWRTAAASCRPRNVNAFCLSVDSSEDLTGSNFVDGRLSRDGNDTYSAVSPLGQHSLPCKFHNATENEISQAVTAAATAFTQFRRQPVSVRADFLRDIGSEIEALGERLIERSHEETGLPLPRLRNERARTVDQLGKFARFIEEGSWVQAHETVGGGVNIRRMLVSGGGTTTLVLVHNVGTKPRTGCIVCIADHG